MLDWNKIDKEAELAVALMDIIDGYSAFDLQQMTGLTLERCQEIIDLVRSYQI